MSTDYDLKGSFWVTNRVIGWVDNPPWERSVDQLLVPPHRVHIAGGEYERDMTKFEKAFRDKWTGGRVVSRVMESVDGQLEENPAAWTLFEANKVRMSVREHRSDMPSWVEVRASCQSMAASTDLYAWLRNNLFLRPQPQTE